MCKKICCLKNLERGWGEGAAPPPHGVRIDEQAGDIADRRSYRRTETERERERERDTELLHREFA